MDDGGNFTCPHCGTLLDVTPGGAPQDVVCSHCGGLTVIPSVDGSFTATTEDEPAPDLDREEELSGVRILQLAAARRAAYRSRSYCVVGAIVCVVAVVEMVRMEVALLRAGSFDLWTATYLLVTILAAWGAIFLFRKAMALDREAKQSAMPPAPGEPDFGPLGDGSERWKKLEDVR
jgi:hypothetical protein